MGIRYTFDVTKAIEVMLYVADRTPDAYHVLKILYFADKQHLSRYGRLICGDSYVAMRHGPVPSGAYDIFKCARGDRTFLNEKTIRKALSVRGNDILPLRLPDIDFLSESDIECLDEAIEEYGAMTFARLRRISHRDAAFKAADLNDFMPLERIVKTLPNGDELLEYLHDA